MPSADCLRSAETICHRYTAGALLLNARADGFFEVAEKFFTHVVVFRDHPLDEDFRFFAYDVARVDQLDERAQSANDLDFDFSTSDS